MSIEIKVGPSTWTIRPLTLRQLISVEKVLKNDDPPAQKSIGVLRAALARDHIENIMDFDGLEGSFTELDAAATAILTLGGFLKPNVTNEADH